MSVITGIWRFDSTQAPVREVRRMLHRLEHCAPDGLTEWNGTGVALGHGLLDTSGDPAALPLHVPASGLTITADARIDNRQELIHACGLSRPERDVSDAELILAAYERWGEASPDKLIGDFAFAIWDQRRRQLFCARDPFGVKPFFYHSSRDRFLFASQIKALFTQPDVASGLNEFRIASQILGFFADRSSTCFQGVHRLPPAHALIVKPDGVRVIRYWAPDMEREIQRFSDEEYVEEFRAIFDEAVRCRLKTAFPVASLLSGGLDSSSIACTAAAQLRASGANLRTFSTIFSHAEGREDNFMNAVLKSGDNLVPESFDGDAVNSFAKLDEADATLDEVFHTLGVTFPTLFYQRARQEGVRVVLDGMGGDGAVSYGLRHFRELLWSRNYSGFGRQVTDYARNFGLDPRSVAEDHVRPYLLELRRERKWLALSSALLRIPMAAHDSVPGFIHKFALHPLAEKMARRSEGGSVAGREPKTAVLNPEFVKSIRLKEYFDSVPSVEMEPSDGVRKNQCYDFTYGTIWMNFEELGRAAAAAQIEPRYPYVDKRLVEFCIALPSSQRLWHGWTRAIQRRAMQGTVPEEICWRNNKAQFVGMFAQSLRTRGRQVLADTIENTPEHLAHYFNLPVLRDRCRRFLAGDDELTVDVWRAANTIRWMAHSELAQIGADRTTQAQGVHA